MTNERLKEVNISMYMNEDDWRTLRAMVDEAKADEPEALKDWNVNSEVCFIITNAINDYRLKQKRGKEND